MSLFAAGMSDPSYDDLEGLLAGPGSVERRGDAARVSVAVADDWRAEVLLRALGVLGPGAEVETSPTGLDVRTAFVPGLYDLAERWHSLAGKHPPAGLRLDGARLWWWCVAGALPKRPATGSAGPPRRRRGLVGGRRSPGSGRGARGAGGQRRLRADGPAYRVVGARRLVRLVELVGAARLRCACRGLAGGRAGRQGARRWPGRPVGRELRGRGAELTRGARRRRQATGGGVRRGKTDTRGPAR